MESKIFDLIKEITSSSKDPKVLVSVSIDPKEFNNITSDTSYKMRDLLDHISYKQTNLEDNHMFQEIGLCLGGVTYKFINTK